MGNKEKSSSEVTKETKKSFALSLVVYIMTRSIFVLAGVVSAIHGDYLTVFLCVLAILVFMLPPIIDRKLHIELPGGLEISAVIFTFMCVVGGELAYFYAKYPIWDKMLHTFSGFLIAAIGLALVEFLNKRKSASLRLSPFFAVMFAFCFALSIEVLWEVFEYCVDIISGTTDMQADYFVESFASKKAGGDTNPVPIVVNGIEKVVITFADGREPLVLNGYIDLGIGDTMIDLMVGALGAFIFCAVEFIALTKRSLGAKRISESFVPKKRESDQEIAMDAILLEIEETAYNKVLALSDPAFLCEKKSSAKETDKETP